MPELGPYGSVRGARGNSRPYRESERPTVKTALLTRSRLGQIAKAGSSVYKGCLPLGGRDGLAH